MKIGIITRGARGARLVENLRNDPDISIISAPIPEELPDFIEDPEGFIAHLGIKEDVFNVDLLINLAHHPDLNPALMTLAAERGVDAGIVIAEHHETFPVELSEISKKYKFPIQVQECGCLLDLCGDETIDRFTSKFGKPIFKVTCKKGVVTQAKVIRGSPCGSTWFAADNMAGENVNDAPAKAGLLIQYYPCMASRGLRGNIHVAGEIHKDAMKRAIEE